MGSLLLKYLLIKLGLVIIVKKNYDLTITLSHVNLNRVQRFIF